MTPPTPKGGLFCGTCGASVRFHPNGVPHHDSRLARSGAPNSRTTISWYGHEITSAENANDDIVWTKHAGWRTA